MLLLVVIPSIFAFWLYVWPIVLEFIVHSHWAVMKKLRWHVGALVLLLTGAFAVGLWVASVQFLPHLKWSDLNAQVGAIGLSAAISFTYGSLVPPAFSPRFLRVTDVTTGDFDGEHHLTRICIPAGQFSPIMLGIWNIGISSWSGRRINVQFPDGFEVKHEDESIPGTAEWDWAASGRDVSFGKNHPFVQVERAGALAPSEPHILRFVLRPPHAHGPQHAFVTVGCGGRFGETQRRVIIDVR